MLQYLVWTEGGMSAAVPLDDPVTRAQAESLVEGLGSHGLGQRFSARIEPLDPAQVQGPGGAAPAVRVVPSEQACLAVRRLEDAIEEASLCGYDDCGADNPLVQMRWLVDTEGASDCICDCC